MFEIYDNWEKLVDAVVRRERDLELCYLSDISSEAGSSFRSDQGSSTDDDMPSSDILEKQDKDCENGFTSRTSVVPVASQIAAEWIEQIVPGVYITIAVRDGTRDLKRIRFNRRRFGERQAEKWWLENKEKVYEKYNLHRLVESSISGEVAPKSEGALPSSYKDSENGMESRTSVFPDASQSEADLLEKYEPGVYITIAVRDGTRDLKRVNFSSRKFGEHQAQKWWLENREKVYEKYNVRRPIEPSISCQADPSAKGTFSPSSQI